VLITKEAAGNIKAAVHLRNMNSVEATRKMYQNIRYMEGKISAGATAQVTVTSRDGTTTELTAKDEVERTIINSNERKYHQTEGGSELLSDALVQDLGCFGEGPLVEQVLAKRYLCPTFWHFSRHHRLPSSMPISRQLTEATRSTHTGSLLECCENMEATKRSHHIC